jgi:hypothetical protein
MMRRQIVLTAIAIAGAASFFALGWLASRNVPPEASPPAKSQARTEELDAGALDPIILIDASSIDLLPGKALRIDPPAPPEP